MFSTFFYWKEQETLLAWNLAHGTGIIFSVQSGGLAIYRYRYDHEWRYALAYAHLSSLLTADTIYWPNYSYRCRLILILMILRNGTNGVPDRGEHGSESEEGCHADCHTSRNRLGWDEERQPWHDYEECTWQVGLDEMVAQFSTEKNRETNGSVPP